MGSPVNSFRFSKKKKKAVSGNQMREPALKTLMYILSCHKIDKDYNNSTGKSKQNSSSYLQKCLS